MRLLRRVLTVERSISLTVEPPILLTVTVAKLQKFEEKECYATHFWGWGKIFLCSILFFPPLTFCSVCLSISFFIACLPARAKRGMAIRTIKNKIDIQTEQKVKGGNNKMLQSKLTSSVSKFTSPAWNWYYSFSREIFTFGEIFKSKDF